MSPIDLIYYEYLYMSLIDQIYYDYLYMSLIDLIYYEYLEHVSDWSYLILKCELWLLYHYKQIT